MVEVKKGWYLHKKGGIAKVLGIVRNSENPSEADVNYVHIAPKKTEPELWRRPITMFYETLVENGQTIQRFAYIKNIANADLTKDQRQEVAKINREIRSWQD